MIALILTYFLLILILSILKTKKFEHPFFILFKSMFPSWKFFDESIDTPVLLYKLVSDEKWSIVFPPPKRRWYNFIWNPQGNLYLAYHSHMQQLMGDLTEFDENKLGQFHEHISYKITENFARIRILKDDFQFKVSSIKKTGDDFIVLEDILISPILKGESK